jgi:cation diffusion facilitator family transporter
MSSDKAPDHHRHDDGHHHDGEPHHHGPDPHRDAVLDALRHDHVFLGANHTSNERRTWAVILLCTGMMLVEVVGGVVFRSMALLADGIHMATHAGAMLIAAAAYFYSRRFLDDPRFSFGTGKIGDLAAFTSGVILASTAVVVAAQSIERLFNPQTIAFDQAIPVAVLGLVVNIASAWLLRDDHQHHGHDHAHGHAQDHPDAHHHDHDDHQHHHDHNLRAAYLHVIADAAVSILAIVGLLAGRQLGWVWMDPAMGLVGAVVIAHWSVGLLKVTGAVLLDMNPGEVLSRTIRRRIETDGDRIADLHVWRVGPGHNAASLVICSAAGLAPSVYRARLAGIDTLSHLTIEVEARAR